MKYLSNCTPTPPLAQQKSTDNKLRSKLGEEMGKCPVAQILTLMRLLHDYPLVVLSLLYQVFLTFRYIYFFFHQVVQGLLFEKFFQIHFRFEMCTIDVTVINFCWLSGLFANPVIHLQHPTPLAMPHTGHVSFFVFIRIKSEGTWLWLLKEEITRTEYISAFFFWTLTRHSNESLKT